MSYLFVDWQRAKANYLMSLASMGYESSLTGWYEVEGRLSNNSEALRYQRADPFCCFESDRT